MKTYEVNGKSLRVGRDVFEIEDIRAIKKSTPYYLDYKIEVMQAFRDGGEIEFCDDYGWYSLETTMWNWQITNYRIIPKPTYEQLQAKWVKENNVIVCDTVPFPHWNWENYKYRVVPEPTYAQLQAKWVEENNVKVGDRVKITGKWDKNELMVDAGYYDYMEKYINQIGRIFKIGITGIYVDFEDGGFYFYPFQVLELVLEPQYRPYCFNDDLLNKIVISKNRVEKYSITGQKRNYVYMNDFAIEYDDLLHDFTWLDGSPCGVKI